MWASTDAAFLSLKEISDMCSIPMNMITVGKLWSSSDLATNVPAEVPTPADFGTCLKQAQAQINYPDTGVMVWAAHMDNWVWAFGTDQDVFWLTLLLVGCHYLPLRHHHGDELGRRLELGRIGHRERLRCH